MFGDASDVFVDNDGDGRMDDLNNDGRIDYRDAQVIVAAAERVEQSFTSLVGGAGVYRGHVRCTVRSPHRRARRSRTLGIGSVTGWPMTPVGYTPPRRKRASRGATQVGAMLIMVAAALGVVQFYHPASRRRPRRSRDRCTRASPPVASLNAFGASREVRLRFALPGSAVEFPLEVSGDPSALAVRVGLARDSTARASRSPGQRRVVRRAEQARLLPPGDRARHGACRSSPSRRSP